MLLVETLTIRKNIYVHDHIIDVVCDHRETYYPMIRVVTR